MYFQINMSKSFSKFYYTVEVWCVFVNNYKVCVSVNRRMEKIGDESETKVQ